MKREHEDTDGILFNVELVVSKKTCKRSKYEEHKLPVMKFSNDTVIKKKKKKNDSEKL